MIDTGKKKLTLPLCRIDLTQNSLSFSGSSLWNDLPKELKDIQSPNSFKRKLRKLLQH